MKREIIFLVILVVLFSLLTACLPPQKVVIKNQTVPIQSKVVLKTQVNESPTWGSVVNWVEYESEVKETPKYNKEVAKLINKSKIIC